MKQIQVAGRYKCTYRDYGCPFIDGSLCAFYSEDLTQTADKELSFHRLAVCKMYFQDGIFISGEKK